MRPEGAARSFRLDDRERGNGADVSLEHYWPGVTVEGFSEAAERLRLSAAELATDSEITFLHSTLVLDDEAAFCVFAASSADLVVEAYRRAGVHYERILGALEMESGKEQT